MATATPARVEPVKLTMSTPLCADSAAPTPGPSPLTRLNTPGGTPASSRISAKIIALEGASSEGLRIIVLPAASAGATLAQIWLSGQFHGVIIATTPTGSCTTRALPTVSEKLNSRSAASVPMKWPRPAGTCAICAKEIGAPISRLVAAASSGRRAFIPAMIFSRIAARSSMLDCDQAGKAARAAATALSTSAAVPKVISVQGCSVEGSITSWRRPPSLSTHAPLI